MAGGGVVAAAEEHLLVSVAADIALVQVVVGVGAVGQAEAHPVLVEVVVVGVGAAGQAEAHPVLVAGIVLVVVEVAGTAAKHYGVHFA